MSADPATDLYSGTKEVAASHKFDEAKLAAFMDSNVAGYEGPLEVRQFKGGQSNPTYQLVTPSKTYVMRRKPPGKLLPSAHAVDREYKVITALGTIGYPVAKTYALCTDESVIGTMFYIMDCVEGRILWDIRLPDYAPDERRAIYDAKNKALATLHTVDYKSIGLGDFGKEGDYVARQIHRWTKQYKLSETETIPEMDKLIEWLPQNIPGGETTSIVHGDYRLDNMVLHPTEPEVIAVLDWELSTLGDPLADFSYHLMQWFMPGDSGARGGLAGLDLGPMGIPTAEEYIGLYCERTKQKSVPNMDYYLSYNMFRLAAIIQGIVGRVRDGTASNANAEANAQRVVPLATAGWDFAKKAGAKG